MGEYMAAQMDSQIEGAQVTRELLERDAERWRYVARHWFKAKAAWNSDKANTPKSLDLTIRAQANASQAEYIERFIDEAIAAERAAAGIGAV
jgi:hypothetical protein